MRYKTPAALEMAVKEAAKKSPLDTNRAIAGFYFHRLLCRVFSDPDSPFVLKGGQSVLARTVDARATRDIDLLARETSVEAAVADLRRLAGIGLDDFISFSFDKAEPIKADDEYRSGMKVWFTPSLGGKSLQAVSVDLVIDEVDGLEPETITPADRLQIDGIPVFDYRIYRAESALADKLLAMVEVHGGRPSSRVKDLVDVVVYAKACRIDSRTLAEQVANESRARNVNLPERFQIPDAWPAVYGKPYAKMARQAKVDDVAPDMVSAEELAAKLYEPALGTHWKHGASTWSPSSLIWAAAEGNDALEPNDSISHSTKTQGR